MSTQVATAGFERIDVAFADPRMRTQLAQAMGVKVEDPTLDRFTRVVLRAVQENPALLAPSVDRTSMFLACQRAAQDKLLPDGRDGSLVLYGNKVQWMPQIHGIRKRAAEYGYSIDAQVVHENDEFEQIQGDDPKIVHRAPGLGKDRGQMIGAYAIFREIKTGTIVHREVMTADQIESVRACSRSKDKGPWLSFPSEMWRKTVAKRGFKSVPIYAEEFQEILRRGDDDYEFVGSAVTAGPAAKPTRPAALAAVAAQAPDEIEPEPPSDVVDDDPNSF
jgi:recombination protein RecT